MFDAPLSIREIGDRSVVAGRQLSTPKCVRCIIQMILVGTPGRPYWRCGNCGAVRTD